MVSFQKQSNLSCSAGDLYDWHGRKGAFERLVPPWKRLNVVSRKGGIEIDSEIRIRVRRFGMSRDWFARISSHEDGHFFEDEQVEGPFAQWRHRHEFTETDPGQCRLSDSIDYELPGGKLGSLIGGGYARSELERVFRYRHAITKSDLSIWSRYRGQSRLRFLVSGGYGMIGQRLVAFLRSQGNEVSVLSRHPKAGDIGWDPEKGEIEKDKLDGFDVVLHLAGKNLADGRWNEKLKAQIWKSRVDGTRLLVDAMRKADQPPKVFACVSGVGYYGDTGDETIGEPAPLGRGYLAELCEAWEAAALSASDFAERTLLLRTGVVIDASGGALPKMLLPFRLGLGGPLGNGRQWMSWIALEDWIAATHYLIREGKSGSYNLVSPRPVRNRAFTKALGDAISRPTVFPAPASLLKLAVGEFATEGLLSSCRAEPMRLIGSGYRFQYEDIGDAIRFVLGKA